ncbi:MAG: PAS domain S-box protein [Bacteroidota bacterium]
MAGKQQVDEDFSKAVYMADGSSIVHITDKDGIILHVNDNFCQISKYVRAELIGKNHSMVIDSHHREAFVKNIWSCIHEGTIWSGKVKNTAKDGTAYWVNTVIMPLPTTEGKVGRFLTISHNITGQVEAEEKLRSAQTYLRSSIESYKDVLIFSIDASFNYRLFNSAFKAATKHVYGTDVEEGMSMLESITVKEDREKAKRNCEKALTGRAHTTLEVYGDMNKVYFETIYSPIVDPNGKIIGVTILSANVTERKLAEEQIIALNKELEAFSYSVAHDLRAPLRSVHGYAQILKEDYEALLDDEGKRIIEVLKSNANKMSTLIDDLLAFSKLGRKDIKKTDINMNDLTEHVVYEIVKLTPHNADVKVEELHHIAGDYGLIYQVMYNIVANAVKYSSKKENPQVNISSSKIDNEVIIAVKDNGAGFDMKYVDKLFGIFQRLHAQHEFEGTGVGLAIVQRIINKHGGKIWAEAEEGKGATFFFKMPGV